MNGYILTSLDRLKILSFSRRNVSPVKFCENRIKICKLGKPCNNTNFFNDRVCAKFEDKTMFITEVMVCPLGISAQYC